MGGREEEELATEVVVAVCGVARKIVRLRELVAERGGDATPIGGFLARALRVAGARTPDGNPNKLRWLINESPRPIEDVRGLGAAAQLTAYLFAALVRGPGHDQGLDEAADEWPNHTTKAAADAALAASRRVTADAMARQVASAHDARSAARRALPRAAPKAGEFVYGDMPEIAEEVPRVS